MSTNKKLAFGIKYHEEQYSNYSIIVTLLHYTDRSQMWRVSIFDHAETWLISFTEADEVKALNKAAYYLNEMEI
jgi:hypothetical protein